MAYATQDDLVSRFGATELIQLTDRTNLPQSTIDADVVSARLGDAEALVDSYLAARYQLPLATVPAVLTNCTCNLARYYLWGDRADVGGPIERAASEATKWLGLVSSGVVRLEIDTGETAPATNDAMAEVFVGRAIFTRDFRGI